MDIIEKNYDGNDVLNICIKIHEGYRRTIGYLLFSVLLLPIGIIMDLLFMYGIFTNKFVNLTLGTIFIYLFFLLFFNLIGIMSLYNWLSANFSKEIFQINNIGMKIYYKKSLFRTGKSLAFEYDDIEEIGVEAKYTNREILYPKCYIKCKGKKYWVGYFKYLYQGENLALTINEFINMK